MKTKTNLIVAAGFLISFVAGVIVGLALTNPGMSVIEAAGAIGKVDKYRNIRVTERDIELRNELMADESLREAYKSYLLYEYTANVKMADDIQYSIEAASQAEGFRAVNAQSLEKLEDYAYFLDNARLQMLEAITTLDGLTDKGPVAIRTVMINAGNAMAQTTYRSNVLFEFITAVELFFDTFNKDEYKELARAHDLLLANLFTASIVNENAPTLEYLSGRELFTENESLAFRAGVLQRIVASDAEKLKVGFTDQESLLNIFLRSEHLNVIYVSDSEALQSILNAEKLEFYSFSELLGDNQTIFNAAGLEAVMQSRQEFLGSSRSALGASYR